MQELTKEKVLLIVVEDKRQKGWLLEEVGKELAELIGACRGEVVDTVFCRIDKPSPAHFIGEGKVREIAEICAGSGIDTVVFSKDLRGSQQRNLEEALKVKTIDRTQLILDIFARHATSQEGRRQVELAQLEYLLPRLVGQGIVLSRLGGGIGTLGPGETKLEMDRRRIADRISRLKKELEGVEASRVVKRKKRKESGIPLVALVGYTNAGKSTLMNVLTDADQVTRNSPFTTLDSLARHFVLPNHQKIVVTDTVGFMHDLPHHLIESFKGTLEHVAEADLLLHVLDVSHPNFRNLHSAVREVLTELGCQDKPVLTVLNKIDQLPEDFALEEMLHIFAPAVAISALEKRNLPSLIEKMSGKLSALMVAIDVMIPINRMDLVNLAHEEGQVLSVKYYNDQIHLRVNLPMKTAGKFDKFNNTK